MALAGLSRRERRAVGPDRRGDGSGRARGGVRGTPGAVRGGGVSKSVAKALRAGIGGEKKRGISTILLARSGSIGAFVADLDNPPPQTGRGCLWAGLRPGRAPRRANGARGPRRRPPRTTPDAETCILHSKVQFQPSLSSAKCTSRRGGAGRGRRGPRRRPRPGTSPVIRRERLTVRHVGMRGARAGRRQACVGHLFEPPGRPTRRSDHVYYAPSPSATLLFLVQ